MRHKLRTAAGRPNYKTRKATAKPVLGQVKARRGSRRFRLRGWDRGRDKVRAEWKPVRATSNRLKLFRSGGLPQTA